MKNEKKMAILDRLVKDGSIDLSEALILLETEKEFIQPIFQPRTILDQPILPNPYRFTCGKEENLSKFDAAILQKMYNKRPNTKTRTVA